MSAKPTILMYNITDKKRKNKIMSFCIMNGIKGKMIGKEQYHQSLTALYEGEDREAEEIVEGDFSEEMLVICNAGVKLDRLLQFLRKEKVNIPLKAVITEKNKNWDSVKLYQEISEEHRQMTQGNTAE